MSDEQIKEITIAMVNKGWLIVGDDNEETAKEIATFINTLKKELNEKNPSKLRKILEEADDDIDYDDSSDDTTLY